MEYIDVDELHNCLVCSDINELYKTPLYKKIYTL